MMLLKYFLLRNLILWSTDPDNGGGGAPPESETVNPPAKTEAATFTPDQQAYIDKLIGAAREKGRESAKKELETAQQKVAQEAEEKRLKEQAEWQKLAETHEARASELEPQVVSLTEKVTAYEALITSMLEAKIKTLGDTAKAAVEALPGSPDVLAKLEWLNANEKLFKTPALGPGNQTKTRPAPQVSVPEPAQRIVRF